MVDNAFTSILIALRLADSFELDPASPDYVADPEDVTDCDYQILSASL